MSEQINMSLQVFKKKLAKRIKPMFLMVALAAVSFPDISASQDLSVKNYGPVPQESIRAYYSSPSLPEVGKREARQTMYIMVTAYNSEVGQTDDTPFITAFGTHVRDGIVATNFLPKGTLVRFPEYSGDKEYVVEDRMNKRYYHHMDIWMEDKPEAIKFGAKFLKMEIL